MMILLMTFAQINRRRCLDLGEAYIKAVIQWVLVMLATVYGLSMLKMLNFGNVLLIYIISIIIAGLIFRKQRHRVATRLKLE